MTLINYTINTKEKRKVYGIIGALLTLMVPFFLMFFNGDNHLETDQSLCPFKMVTGFPCPGCGITKSLVYFYEGDFYKSISYHVLGPFVIVFCIVTIVVLTMELITQKEYFNAVLYNKKLAYGLGFFLVVYHIIRLVFFIKNHSLDAILKESIWR
ncbi:DUF2752 domain-containing protein [Flavobacterium sp. 83]|jgi:hypothetical protein|uniref:DUF2752 domain-containing protein n=1 Tax=Flavobacterium sp. 83 TaxID=1131812 RepID=UPI0005563951|nr:DUF2752 domain-containing protein [Flavobacterium sp. 83]